MQGACMQHGDMLPDEKATSLRAIEAQISSQMPPGMCIKSIRRTELMMEALQFLIHALLRRCCSCQQTTRHLAGANAKFQRFQVKQQEFA
jgi:hypothetical protein